MQKQAKRGRIFLCRDVIGRGHALRSLFARTDGSRAVCVDSVPSRFDLHNALNSTGRMTGHSETILIEFRFDAIRSLKNEHRGKCQGIGGRETRCSSGGTSSFANDLISYS
jgi:hypothetical protein